MSAASTKKLPKSKFRRIVSAPKINAEDKKRNTKALSSLTYDPRQAIVVTVLAFLISNVGAALLASIYPAIKGMNTTQANEWLQKSAWAQFSLFVVSSIILAGVLIWYVRRRKQPLDQIGMNKPKVKYFAVGIAAFLPYLITLAFVLAFVAAFIPAVNVAQEQEIFTAQTSGFTKILPFIPLVLLAPFIEEALFRGFLFSGLRKRFSFWTVTMIVSALFGALHLSASSAGPLWVAAIDTALLSVFLCYLREKTGSIWAGVALHFTKNLIAFLSVFIIS